MKKKLFNYVIGFDVCFGVCKANSLEEATNKVFDKYPDKREYMLIIEITDDLFDEEDAVEIANL